MKGESIKKLFREAALGCGYLLLYLILRSSSVPSITLQLGSMSSLSTDTSQLT